MPGEIDAFLAFGRPIARAPKIEGETFDVIEKEEVDGLARSIQIKSYTASFEVTTTNTEETNSQSGGTQAPRWEPGDFTITKQVDAATPALLSSLAKAGRYECVVVSQRKAGGTKGMSGDYFWIIQLNDVAISRLTWNADDGPTTEQITLKYYGDITVWYYRQKATGALEQTGIQGVAQQEQSVKSKNTGDGNGANLGNLTNQQTQDLARKLAPMIAKEFKTQHINLK